MPSKKINTKETIPVVHGMRGRVISVKLPQTVTVLIEREKMHPLYRKAVKRGKKYLVFDPFGVVDGDLVEIQQVRPLSKNKHFAITRVLGRDIEAIVTEQLKEKAAEQIAEVMPEEKETQNDPGGLSPDKIGVSKLASLERERSGPKGQNVSKSVPIKSGSDNPDIRSADKSGSRSRSDTLKRTRKVKKEPK